MPFPGTDIPGLLVFEPKVFEDSRGYFFESYNEIVLQQQGIDIRWVQDNQSSSGYGVIRGLHYQLNPYAQAKLLRVLHGAIIDIVVDIRKGSPTFGEHYSVELSAANKKQLFIPTGFAHGFSALSNGAEILYKCSQLYNKDSEKGIRFDDPALNIDWKIPRDRIIVSEKDRELPLLADCMNDFIFQG